MRKAPPTVPGTPIRPSIPPRLFFAQKVTVRPRSAAASTLAKLPSRRTSGSCPTSCRTTQGSSPSWTSRLVPPPRKRWGMPCSPRRWSTAGIVSCLFNRSRSVAPPIASEVISAKADPLRTSTPSSGSAASNLGSLIFMCARLSSSRFVRDLGQPRVRAQENDELITGAADASGPDGQDRIARTRLPDELLDALPHGSKIENVLMARVTDCAGERLARDPGNRSLARRIDIRQNENIGLIERAAEFIPEMLRACIAMRLEKNEQAVELSPARPLERGANLRKGMGVNVDYRDVVHQPPDVETAAHRRKKRPFLSGEVD